MGRLVSVMVAPSLCIRVSMVINLVHSMIHLRPGDCSCPFDEEWGLRDHFMIDFLLL